MSRQKSKSPLSGLKKIEEEIESLLQHSSIEDLSDHSRRRMLVQLHRLADQLALAMGSIDPIGTPMHVFDPANPKLVGRFTALALVAQDRIGLDKIRRHYGSGTYAIYYNGDHELYRPIAKTETPIYVGKASPSSSNARTPVEQGEKLTARLTEHFRSIKSASTTLNPSDFEFRALVVQSGWEAAAEDYLIRLFKPVWNNETKLVFGIGKHGDSAKTRANRRSPWDTVHPGRKWADNEILVDAKTESAIGDELAKHFANNKPFNSYEEVLASFVAELKQS